MYVKTLLWYMLHKSAHVLYVLGKPRWCRLLEATHFEWNAGGECVTVVDDGRAIISIPTVQLHTPAALQQHL